MTIRTLEGERRTWSPSQGWRAARRPYQGVDGCLHSQLGLCTGRKTAVEAGHTVQQPLLQELDLQ